MPLGSLLFFLLPSLAYAQDALHMNLVRRVPLDASTRTIDYGKEMERLRYRYGYRNTTTESRKRASVAGIPIINQNSDSTYFGNIAVGTPSQNFQIVLDTGSSDLWLADSTCQACGRSITLYDPTSSSTFKGAASTQPILIQYGSGKVQGTLAQDTVSMGGFTIESQTLLAVDALTQGLVDGSVSGIMGLAWAPLASTQSTPFWQSLAQDGQLTSPEMSFWLTREINNPRAPVQAFGGVFTLGGTNATLFTGDIDFLNMPVQTPTFWLLGLSQLTVNGQNIRLETGNAALSAIDTGTTLIGGPSSAVAAFWAAVPGSQASTQNQGLYTFPCSTKLSVSLSFGGKVWPINPVDMNLGPETQGGSQCLGAIFDLSMGSDIPSSSANPSWVVGDTFLKNVYSVFRASPPSIGFAQLSSTAGGSGAPGPASGSVVISTHYSTATVVDHTTVYVDPTGSPGTGSSTGGAVSTQAPLMMMGLVFSAFVSMFMLV